MVQPAHAVSDSVLASQLASALARAGVAPAAASAATAALRQDDIAARDAAAIAAHPPVVPAVTATAALIADGVLAQMRQRELERYRRSPGGRGHAPRLLDHEQRGGRLRGRA